jgi:hypothetical protein
MYARLRPTPSKQLSSKYWQRYTGRPTFIDKKFQGVHYSRHAVPPFQEEAIAALKAECSWAD